MVKTSLVRLAIAAVLATAAASRPGYAVTYSFLNFDGPDASETIATGISNTGAVTGYELVATTGAVNGFIRMADGTSTLFAVPGASATPAYGINASGQVVGSYVNGNNGGAFVRAADGTITLLNDPSGNTTYAFGINDLGQITQATVDASGAQNYFVRNPDGSTTALSVPGPAFGINASGAVTGSYFSSGQFQSAYLASPSGGYVGFDNPAAQGNETQGYGVNDLGFVAGTYNDVVRGAHFGYVRSPDGSFSNLADPASTGGTYAIGINNAGQVSGYYDSGDGNVRGFIATPIVDVPEPASAALLGLGVVGAVIGRAKRDRVKRQAA